MSPKLTSSIVVHDDEETAALLKTSVSTLARWRANGKGPRFIKIGRRVAYRPTDLDDWLTKQTHTSTAQGRRR